MGKITYHFGTRSKQKQPITPTQLALSGVSKALDFSDTSITPVKQQKKSMELEGDVHKRKRPEDDMFRDIVAAISTPQCTKTNTHQLLSNEKDKSKTLSEQLEQKE